MVKLRTLVGVVSTVVALGVVGVPVGATTPAAAGPIAGVQDLSADLALDCGSETVDVAVSVQVPRVVRSGQAFSLTTSRAGDVGALRLALTHTSPEAVFVGSTRPSTTQVVARGTPGAAIDLQVTGSTRIDVVTPGLPPVVETTTCTVVGDGHLGTVRIAGGTPPGPATAGVDVTVYLTCTYKSWFGLGPDAVRISFTAPTRVAPGEVFSLSGLDDDATGETFVLLVADGADVVNPPPFNYIPYLSPSSELHTTAPAGGEISIRLFFVAHFAAGIPAAACSAVGSSVLATIPVVEP